ncbi:MAG: putative Ig domain-containing protein, partial [Nitrospira sp.]|nr:putative Ig domain-containing protein [Nitrospira sp.]
FTSGFAFDQILSAEDFLEHIRPQLQPGEKIDLVGYSLSGNIVRTLAAMHPDVINQTPGSNVVFNATGLGEFRDPTGQDRSRDVVLREMMELYRRVEADPNNATDVPFHLLPLQLTAIAAAPIDRMDPNGNIYSTPRQDFAQAYIQNRYGTFYNDFGRTVAEPSFAQYVGVALSGFDVAAVANSGSHPAPFGIAIEGQPAVELPGLAPRFDYLNTHSLTLIADSLRLQILFKEIDSSISTDAIQAIFQASSASAANTLFGRAEKDTLENALDAVRKALLPVDQNFQPTPSSDAAGSFGNIANRTAFHNNITAVENVLPPQPSPYRIETLVNRPLEEVKGNALLEDEAGKGLAYRYALTVLNPFAIIGPTYSQHNPNEELALFDPTTGLGTITSDYIQDRGLFLAAKVALNQANLDGPLNPFALTHFHDNTLMYDISSGLSIPPGMQREYIFGSDNAETFTGGPLFTNDHLYGADGGDTLQGLGGDDYLQGDGGDDTLDGGSGADRMIGGQGNDTYLVDNTGDRVTEGLDNGSDTVQSSVSFVLAENLEDLTLTGTSDLNGTGNGLDNLITGTSGMNRLEGKGGVDHLIGNGGNDILIGGTGDEDLLEGGIGFDTYLYNAGDGLDRIEDSDADGVIKVNGQVLAGGVKKKGDPTWESPDGTIEYVMSGTDLLVKLNGTQILIVNENFQSGQFGIRLIDATSLPDDTLPTISYDNGYSTDSISLDGDADGKHVTEEGGINWIVQGSDDPELIWADNPLSTTFRAQNQQVFGNGGSDLIIGDFNDRLDGGAGDDMIRANWGEDVVYGRAGRDLIMGDLNYYGQALGGTYDDYLDGGSEQDSLSGMAGNDTLFGGEGDDELFADDSLVYAQRPIGNDYLDGGEGHDRLYAGMGDDALYGGGGDDRLFGDNRPEGEDVYVWTVRPEVDDVFQGFEFSISAGAGSPIFSAQGGTDYLDGGVGNDYLQGDGGDDVLLGGAGADELWGDDQQIEAVQEGDDWLDGGAGDDQLVGGGGADTLSGGEGDDVLAGDYANNSTLGFADILDGGAGSDELQGGGGDDVLDGGSENDRLFGEEDNDNLYGGTGDDQLQGGNGNDMLFGEEGVDLLAGQDGDDQLFGDGGDDQLSGGAGVDQLVGGLGDDLLQGEADHDTLFGDEGNDELQGGDGNDTLLGGVGSDVLFGDEGDDTLWGEDGDDQIVGGAGDDLVDGGTGDDVLGGLTGMDTYRIGRGDGIDTIVDTAGEGNRIVFEDITSEEIIIELATNALVLQIGPSGQQVAIAGFRSNNALAPSAIDRYQFADGSLFTHADLVARGLGIPATVLTSGTITGVVGAGGSGADGLGGTNLNDYLSGGAGEDSLTGLAGDDLLLGGDGRDYLDGNLGNDILDGGAGDDYLEGGQFGAENDDTYRYHLGDGLDTVDDGSGFGSEVNTLQLGTGITPGMISLAIIDNLLTIRVGSEFAGVQLWNTDLSDVLGRHDIQVLTFADGTTLTYEALAARGPIDVLNTPGVEWPLMGTNLSDRVVGGAGDDFLWGGQGNDLLRGGAGHDTYVFNLGDGIDTIEDTATGGEGNQIQLGAGITQSDLVFMHNESARMLAIQVGSSGTDQLILTDFDPTGVRGSLVAETLTFDDGSTASLASVLGVAANHAPTVANPLTDQVTQEDVPFSFVVPAYTFADQDGGDTLMFSATLADGTALPTWLTFDASTRTFSGTPVNSDVGLLALAVTVTDSGNLRATSTFSLGVQNVNDAPTVAVPLTDQSATQGSLFNFVVPTNTFSDQDVVHGDTVTYSATQADGTALPTWLTFNPSTRTFSGT